MNLDQAAKPQPAAHSNQGEAGNHRNASPAGGFASFLKGLALTARNLVLPVALALLVSTGDRDDESGGNTDQAERLVHDCVDQQAWTAELKSKVKVLVMKYVQAADFPWDHPIGPFGRCGPWTQEYLRNVQRLKLHDPAMRHYLSVDGVVWGNSCLRWVPGLPGHCAIAISFPNGAVLYLDDGWYAGGKGKHIWTPAKIPSYWFEVVSPVFPRPRLDLSAHPLQNDGVRALPESTNIPGLHK